MNFKFFFLFGILLVIASISYSQNYINFQEVKISEEQIIGNYTDASGNAFLGRPTDIAVDEYGYIYITDEASMMIKVYKRDGSFERAIGRRGRGPGEFLSLSNLNIYGDEVLQVIDLMNYRITEFNHNDEVIRSINFSNTARELMFIREAQRIGANNLLLYKKINFSGTGTYEDEIIHIWDDKFEKKLDKFGSFNALDYEKGFNEKVGKLHVGSVYFKNHKTIIFAPNLYKGELFLYRKNNGSWLFERRFKGYENLPSPITKTFDTDPGRDDVIKINTQEGQFIGKIYVASAGIFTLNNGLTAHFTFIKNEDKWILGIETFDKSLNFLSYHQLRLFDEYFSLLKPVIKAKDKKDNFYMLSGKNGMPIVLKFSLDFN